jgi:hypothetical protein
MSAPARRHADLVPTTGRANQLSSASSSAALFVGTSLYIQPLSLKMAKPTCPFERILGGLHHQYCRI